MTRRRWIADEVEGDRAALTGEHAYHLSHVLRARIGQSFEISSGDRVRLGIIVSVTDQRVELELGEEVPQPAARSVSLYLSIFKFDRMEWAIEKATELGVVRIVPVSARRSDSHLVAAAEKRVERWRRISLQAAQQARRTAPPEITSPQNLKQALDTDCALRIVLAESEHGTSLRQALTSADSQADVALAIGPEGGWTANEIRNFEIAGWQAASLGNNILRAETAALAAMAITISELS